MRNNKSRHNSYRKSSYLKKNDSINKCPYCGKPMLLKPEAEVHKKYNDGKMVYVCAGYPECDTYIMGVLFKNEWILKGIPGNALVRSRRIEAHHYFNYLADLGIFSSRKASYEWLAAKLDINVSSCHMSNFSTYQCEKTIEESIKVLLANSSKIGSIKPFRRTHNITPYSEKNEYLCNMVNLLCPTSIAL